MSNSTFQIIISIAETIVDLIVFLVAVGASYWVLQQPPLAKWLENARLGVKAIALLIITNSLIGIGFRIVSYVFSLPYGLVNSRNGFETSFDCFAGLVMLGILIGAIILSGRGQTPRIATPDSERRNSDGSA